MAVHTPQQLIERAAQAIRRLKYYRGGTVEWRSRPPSDIDRRYATAAMVELLLSLASSGATLDATGMTRLAHAIDKQGGDL